MSADATSRELNTRLLRESADGRCGQVDVLLDAVYEELRRLARAYLGRERPGHTLAPTALVHEAYLQLIDQSKTDWKDRAHFIGVASHIMRRTLKEYARRRGAEKRGGGRLRVPLEDDARSDPGPARDGIDFLALEESLSELEALDERKARVVELRYFGGMTCEEVAKALDVSLTTVESDWYFARSWLRSRLEG